MSSLRRYAPFALLVAAQTVLVLIAPSRSTGGSGLLGGTFTGGPAASNGPQTGGAAPGPGASLPAGASPGAAPTGPGALPQTGPGGTGPGGQQQATGRTASGTWCVTGLLEHPPCAPKWAGGSNGGATWQGVTAKTVTIVMYRNKDNPAVDAILQETGTYTPPSAEQQMLGVVGKWINQHYQLYGRTIHFVWTQGTCDIAPPSDTCFRSDADAIVSQYHPFAVFWDNDTNEPAFFDELSRKGVVNWGGWGFTDSFNDGLRPYHYDGFMGGDQQAEITGAWYCKRLAGHKAEYAGDATLKTQIRKVAVVYPDTATTTPSAHHLEQILQGCAGSSNVVDSPYSSDTSTAASQATSNTAKLKSAGVTSILWMSDPIAPAYGTKAEAAQQWFPEEIIAGGGLLDYDALAQTYDQSEWAHAFGPSDIAQVLPIDQSDAGRIWRAEGNSGSPNANSNLMTSYALIVASGVEAAGPKLTPLSYEYGMLTMPGYDSYRQWHDPRLYYVKFGRGDYTALSDIREVYWDGSKTSLTNGRQGAYVALDNGARYDLGDLPSGEPRLPAGL